MRRPLVLPFEGPEEGRGERKYIRSGHASVQEGQDICCLVSGLLVWKLGTKEWQPRSYKTEDVLPGGWRLTTCKRMSLPRGMDDDAVSRGIASSITEISDRPSAEPRCTGA